MLSAAEANGFRILRLIAEGGMGVVYEAVDTRRNARVALKTVHNISADGLARFKREFRLLQDVQHPNLVSLGELVVDGETCFFTMELVEGVDFISWVRGGRRESALAASAELALAVTAQIRKEAPLGFDEARLRAALPQLVRALDAAHAAGVIHRDVKPDNVRVTPGGRVVLLDFGLALDVAGTASLGTNIAGTPAYMAPEQAMAGTIGPAADWYSVGALLYESLTGALPFTGDGLQVLLEKQRREPEPPRALVPGVAKDLDALCARLLRFDAAARPKAEGILAAIGVQVPALASATQTQTTPFVGRSPELTLLRRAFDDSRRKAVAVIVEGESGVGKSCLVRHFLDSLALESPGLVTLSGRCYERESVPYKGFDGVVDALAQFLARQPPALVAACLPTKPAALVQVFPVLLRVKAIAELRTRQPTAIDPVEIRSQAFGALRDMLTRIGDRRPLVLLIDDVQWADADGLALISHLLRGHDPPPLLLAATRRIDVTAAFGASALLAGDVRAVRLDRLSMPESRELASRLARRASSPEAQLDPEAIAREAEGHPLFIDALVRYGAMAEGATLRLEDALRARVERLDDGSRRVTELVAVAGGPISPQVLGSAAEIDASALARTVAILRVSSLVKTSGLTLERLEPFHDRVRDAVLATLDETAREKLHRALAIALETEQADDAESLAFHWRAAKDDGRAARWALVAADEAAATLGFDRAAALYDLALDLVARTGDEQRAIQVKLGDALANAGRGGLAAQAYAAAAEGAVAALGLDLRRRAADQLLRSGLFDEGLAAIRSVLVAVGARMHATPLRAVLAVLFFRLYIRVRGLDFVRRDPSQISPHDLTCVDIYWSVSFGLALVDNIRGAAFQARHLTEALRVGEPYRVARALATEVAYVARSGARAWPRTVALIERVRVLAESTNDPHAIGWAYATAGLAHYLNGKFPEAVDLLVKGEHTLRDECTGAAWEVDSSRTIAISALVQLGKLREVCDLQPAYLKDALDRGDRFAAVNLRIGYCNFVWLVADDPDRASREATEAMREWSQAGFHIEHYYMLISLTAADLYAGRAMSAHARIARAWPELRRSMLLGVHAVAIAALAMRARATLALAESDESQRAALVKAAERDARKLDRYDAPYASAFAHLTLAAASRLSGRYADTARLLREAIALFEAAHMQMYTEAARACLGRVLGGEEGTVTTARAEAWLRDAGVVAPAKIVHALSPGFRGLEGAGKSGGAGRRLGERREA